MEQAGSMKRSFFSKRVSTDQGHQTKLSRPSDVDLLHRPIAALAKHRIHQLSDIRELSGSSKAATVKKKLSGLLDGTKDLPRTPEPQQDVTSESASSTHMSPPAKVPGKQPDLTGLGSRATSAMSLPFRDVPEWRSSVSIFAQSLRGSRKPSLSEMAKSQIPAEPQQQRTVSVRGRSDSPVRHALNKSTQSSEAMRPSPSRTFIRTTPPVEILERGSIKNDRVELSVRLPSPVFVGGGTIEGHVRLEVHDDASKKGRSRPISISRLSLDVIGVEEVSDGRRWIFLSLGSELFDEQRPPPPSLVNTRRLHQDSELSWNMKPGMAVIPFCINLPLNLGPSPYLSRHASIRYIFSPTAQLKVGDKRQLVRQTWNIQMLTVHDPEKALASLPSPLLATDSLTLSNTAELQTIKLTAGLHRQTWVNGSKIFVDVHVVNGTSKNIKKLELRLEKTILWYSHAAAGTAEKGANHLRLPKRSDTDVVSTTSIRKSKDWKGIAAHNSEVRTCELKVPRGHVTVSTGRYFEVRYFINVTASISMFKSCAVQLPVSLIHINSLDILPNSLAQVAASIEAKRARTLPVQRDVYQPYHQGQAFTAPGRHSLEQARRTGATSANDISLLTQDLDNSPRRYSNVHGHHHERQNIRQENLAPSLPSAAHHHHLRHPSCYHCHLQFNKDGERPGTAVSLVSQGMRLPRLQVSTSGLGFSESEFEVPADPPPRKVMLSEQERKLIHQQRELNMQRQWSQRTRKNSVDMGRANRVAEATFKNVAADPGAGPKQPAFGNLSEGGPRPQSKIPKRSDSVRSRNAPQTRPRPPPDRMAMMGGPAGNQRMMRHNGSMTRERGHVDGSNMVVKDREQLVKRGQAGMDRLP